MNSSQTQIARKGLSAPMRHLQACGWLPDYTDTVLHHGEGKSFKDTELMEGTSLMTQVYEPASLDPTKNDEYIVKNGWFDKIYSIYVFNTLLPVERSDAFVQMVDSLAECGSAFVAVRTEKFLTGTVVEDGVITKRNTFQTQLLADEWLIWMKRHAGKDFHVSVLHRGSGYCIIKIRRLESL